MTDPRHPLVGGADDPDLPPMRHVPTGVARPTAPMDGHRTHAPDGVRLPTGSPRNTMDATGQGRTEPPEPQSVPPRGHAAGRRTRSPVQL